MKRAIRAETLKLLTTRATFGILLGAVGINVLAFVAPGENIISELSKPLHEQQSVFLVAFLMRVLILVLGIRAITDEWRYGTITPSLLVVPARGRFLKSKVAATMVAGTVIAAIATAAMVVTAYAVAVANDTAFDVGSDDLVTIVGMVGAGALWAAIGVGFGAVVKSQLLATVSGLVWLMAIEDAIRGRLGDLAGYLPGQAGLTLVVSPSVEFGVRGASILATYALVVVVAGVMLLRHRDV
jgi:ABC-2 type transport system permease protein